MENTEDIYLLDKLRPPKGYETVGALLCTYSIDAKALLSALLYMRDIPAKGMDSGTSLYRGYEMDGETHRICM